MIEGAGPAAISDREAEVLTALGAHLTNAQIANRLHISVRTVEAHVASLLRKSGYANRRELAALADRVGTGSPALGGIAALPTTVTTFVGRAAERDLVVAALDADRLVNLLGPGGVGKTRLAVSVVEQAASAFPFGVFVDLVPVRAGYVMRAVASALGATEGSHQLLIDAVVDRLGDRRSLVVLDNCEHVVEEVAGLADRILAVCPGTRILATSRERLGVAGERCVPVGPLPLEPDATQLFRDRALAADPGFVDDHDAIAEVCAKLDGVPLAIELAAARSASLGTSGLLAALDDTMRLLSGGRGSDERHRSLHGVISWSYDLLDSEEQALFRRLGVFAGAFDLAGAHAVAGSASGVADLLGRLVDKSLVRHLRGTTGRWCLLETIRAFALERLTAAGEADVVHRLHLVWAADAAQALERGRNGPWQAEFDAVAGDLRAALARAAPGPDDVSHRLARSLAQLTYARRHLTEALGHYRAAARHAMTAVDAAHDLRLAAGCAHVSTISDQLVFDLLVAAADEAGRADDLDARANDLARAVETACRYADPSDVDVPRDRLRTMYDEAVAITDTDEGGVAATQALAHAWLVGPDNSPDGHLAESALAAARATGDVAAVSAGLAAVAAAALHAGRFQDASRVARQRLALLPDMDRDDPRFAPEICSTLGRACSYALTAGDVPAALAAAHAGLDDDLLRRSHLTASRLVPPLVLCGRLQEATEQATEMWETWQRAGRPPSGVATGFALAALAHGLLGDEAGCTTWRARFRELAARTAPPPRRSAVLAFVDARLAIHGSGPGDAAALVEHGFAEFEADDPFAGYARAVAAELSIVTGLPDAASRLDRASAVAAENDWAMACLTRATGRLHADPGALRDAVSRWERLDARLERACTLVLIPERAAEGRAELADLAHRR